MPKVTILGAGVMGSAMAMPAAAMGHEVALVGTHLDEETIRSVAGNGRNPKLNVVMPEAVTAYEWTRFGEALGDDTDLLILGVSSAGVGWAVDRLSETLRGPVPVLMITKGLAPVGGTIEVLPHVVARAVKERTGIDLTVMAVGGPCIAGELAVHRDTGVVITGPRRSVDEALGLLSAPFYHARASEDVIGVELCAAFKNFYAIGVGWAAGMLDAGDAAPNGAKAHNLAASLFTQAVAELTIMVERLGGSRESVMGLPGVGDLYVTCQAGRNSRMGRLLGQGLTYGAAKAGPMAADTVEGAELAQALGPTLEAMWASGRLPAGAMPLSRAIVAAICRDEPLAPDWPAFHAPPQPLPAGALHA